MPVQVQLHDTHKLLGVMRELAPPSNYWLDLCFGRQINFETKYIDFEKLTSMRRLAPFVAPSAQGKPIFSEGSTVQRFEPAYVKPKDVVSADRQMSRRPGELLDATAMSPRQRWNAAIADILRCHRESIERRNEWLAARAIIDGQVTIADENYPERTVVFGRASNHTVVLSGGSVWSTTSDIIKDIETWRTRVRRAPFGGAVDRITMGVDVWDVVRKNADVLKLLDTQVRGTDANFRTGVREGTDVEYMGRLSNNLDLYVYNDYYQDYTGAVVPFMGSKEVVLTGPSVDGVRCFGAIQDKGADLRALPIFPKMWDQEDPSATYIMSQSAPLMVPVNPNCTLKATVLA